VYPYRPVVPRGPVLGQLASLQSGLTQDIAQQIVSAADQPTRAIIRDERNRLAEGLIGGLPFAALSGLAAVGTFYLVPEDSNLAKFAGYAVSLASMGIGAIWTYSQITADSAPAAPSTPAPAVVQQTAQAIVQAADPAIRTIVDEERARIASAAQTMLPFAGAGAVGAIATAVFVPQEDPGYKVLGYSAAVLVTLIGAWVGLQKEQSS